MANIQKPAMVDRRGEALGGQSVDRSLSAIKNIVWHYTATHSSFITNHERYWKNTHGWGRGGYHFYIGRDGTIYWNYNLERITYGVAYSNAFTCHMSLEALNANDYTQAQIKSREALTRWLMQELKLPSSAVKGHYEVYNNSACPGYTRSEMDAFRKQLAKPTVQVAGSSVHKVVSGDTLWKIAIDNKMTVAELKALNNLKSDLIVPNQVLKVSGTATVNPTPPKKSIETIANEVIEGKWKTGDERKKLLTNAGYNASEVQKKVNEILADNTPKKEYIYLPKTNKTWGVYYLSQSPVSSNIQGKYLAPSQFGGLEYSVVRWDQTNVAVINTGTYGQVKIYVGPDTNAKRYWR